MAFWIAGGVDQRVGVAVAGSVAEDLLKNLDYVADTVGLAHDEDRDDGGARHHREAIEAAGLRPARPKNGPRLPRALAF